MANKNLNAAKAAKKDEFYTQLADIERELGHYWHHFRDKIVLCNCDDPYESNFFKYFALRFNQLGLKKLICTCYDGSPVMGTQLSVFGLDKDGAQKKLAYKVEITEVTDCNGDGAVDLADVEYLIQNDKNILSCLQGNGDFRSRECIKLLQQADIVVTNPPFSLFREYIGQLIEYEKKFLIIGNMNALHYKEIFPLIKDNQIWLGYTSPKEFSVAENLERDNIMVRNGLRIAIFGNIIWFTNLDHQKRHEVIELINSYSPDSYPHYDNYDAIDVKEINSIPYDWSGVMGVPDSILIQYNPEQFEIIGLGSGNLAKEIGVQKNYRGRTDLSYTINGKSKCPYSRILIRNKHPRTL